MLLTNTHLTPVIGIDIHFTTLPPFNPFQPYIGVILDPMDYIPYIGATVHVNGKKRGVSDTQGIIIPLVHIPLIGPFVMSAIIGNESMNFFASKRVFADGTRLSPKGYFQMTCNDIGIPLSLEPGKVKFWKLVPTLFAPTSYSIPINMGAPVNVGGPYPPDWAGILMGLAMSFGFGAVMRGVGKLLKTVNWKFFKTGGKFRQKVSNVFCYLGFEPINLVTGSVVYQGTDFTIQGVIPLEWNRSWDSSNDYDSILGYGCQFNYDLDIVIVPDEDVIAVRFEDGRVLGLPLINEGEEVYIRQGKLTIRRKESSFEVFHHDKQQTFYYEQKDSSLRYRISRIENAAGFCLKFNYRGGLLKQIVDTAQRVIDIFYTDDSRVSSVWLVSENAKKEILVAYKYSDGGDMIAITDSMGKSTLIDYENHLMVRKTDRDGQAFYWEYDGKSTEARCIHTWGDGGYQEGWIEYHSQEGYNIVSDCTQAETTYYYEPSQLVTRIQDPLGHEKRFEYTEHMELYREWNEEGQLTGYTYDDFGNRTNIVYPDGSTETFMYDEYNRLTMSVNGEGQKRLYIYRKDKNLLNSIIEPDNSISVFEYDDNNLLKEIRRNGESVYLSYDSSHNLTSLCDAKEASTFWNYDYRGNVLGVQSPLGAYQGFTYDKLNRVTAIGAGGKVTEFAYNSYEDILEVCDHHRKVNFTYTPMGSLSSRKENDVTIRFAYDKMERLRYLTNEYGERYSFTRNLRGDIIKETGFDNLKREYLRDRAGKVIKVLRPDERWTEYTYDLNGRIIRADYSDETWELYTYDKNGRIIECRNQDNRIAFERDKMGRVVKEIYSSGISGDEGISISSVYDVNGNRTRLTSSLGADIRNKFDKLGNITEIEALNADLEDSWQAKIQRNALGLEIEKTVTGCVSIMRSYDDFGRPLTQVVNQGHSRQREIYNRRYAWNVNDQLLSVLNGITNGHVTYAYDAIGNLASAHYEDGSYEYKMPDELGNVYRNKDHSDREYAKGGQLLRDCDYNYFYDGEGNLVLKKKRGITGIASLDYIRPNRWIIDPNKSYVPPKEYTEDEKLALSAQWEAERLNPQWHRGDYAYFWQGNGMLQSVKTPEGKIVSFEYDALGRRTAKLCNNKIFRYLWDGNVLLHDWVYDVVDRPKPVVDELGVPKIDTIEPTPNVVTWVYEDGSFVPSAKLVNSERYSIVSDYIGRPVQAYDDTGQVVWQTDYDIYGGLRNLNGEREFIPFRQLGQFEDEETRLYYNRFRFYDPNVGSYISQDPIGLAGKNPTFYGYVIDANIRFDILGLGECKWKGFSKNQLDKHYQKHVINQKEFGNITKKQYLDRAKAFAATTGENIKETNVGNFFIKNNIDTGEVFVGHTKSREIRTYYIDDGRSPDAFEAAIDYAKEF